MAKIDTSSIEGYDGMTPEQKIAALEGFEFKTPEPAADSAAELQRMKNAVSKANSEAAEYKRQLRAHQSEEEVKAAQEKELREKLEQELESLRTEKAISALTASYLGLGYGEDMAKANAQALHDRDYQTVFANQKKFLEDLKKSAAADALKAQPDLTQGASMSGDAAEAQIMDELRRRMSLPPKDAKG